MPEPLLEVSGLTFCYEDLTMVFDLSLDRGECLALLGPSGASNPAIRLNKVDLPAPLGPSRAKHSPRSTLRSKTMVKSS